MVLKSVFIARTPDAIPEQHNAKIETKMHTLFIYMVRNHEQAKNVCVDLSCNQNINLIYLCPAFTNKEVAEISDIVGENVAVTVARGDGPSTRIFSTIIKDAGWLKK